VLLKTILNNRYKCKSFVYKNATFEGENLIIEIRPRVNSQAICSSCKSPAPCYDTSPQPRRFEFIPILGFKVFFSYTMRRVSCACGVKVEQVPWAEGKTEVSTPFMLFLASWAKGLSWQEIADRFKVTWNKVFRSVKHVVEWGLASRDLNGIRAIGVDEISWRKGYSFLTLVYQLDGACRRLLWVAEDRTVRPILGFFRWLGKERSSLIKYVCSDMWKPYLKVIARKAGEAIHVLDRFHIAKWMNKAVDEVRINEQKNLSREGYETLKHSRWCLLKHKENLTDKQSIKLKELLHKRLKSVKAYLMKEEFHKFWKFISVGWASKFLDSWTRMAIRSRIKPMKRVARILLSYRSLILNWFKAKEEIKSAAVEGLNNKAKVTTKKAYGFRTFKCIQIALFHALGGLPQPELTHRLW